LTQTKKKQRLVYSFNHKTPIQKVSLSKNAKRQLRMTTTVPDAIAPTRNRNRVNGPTRNQKWTPAEDALLRQSVTRSSAMNWKALESQFPGKTSQQLFERWTKVLDPVLLKGSWTRQEDEVILNFVQVHGCKTWTKLAKMLPGRIGKQCRERWMNHLNPDLCRDQWTDEEDARLINLHQEFGNKWSRIAEHMPGRADNMIKNRWYSILSKKSPEEMSAVIARSQDTESQQAAPRQVRESMPLPALEETVADPIPVWSSTFGATPTFISPAIQMISPFSLLSPCQRISLFSPWGSETPRNGFPSPTSKGEVTPTLSENRAELMNLIVNQ
jgi:hypothetical protein